MNNCWKWSYKLEEYEQDECVNDVFDTKEEAIKEAIKAAKEFKSEQIYIGAAIQDAIPVIDVDEVIDNIVNDMYEAYGELAEGYLNCIKNEQALDLEKKLNAVLQEWLKNNNLEPNFYHIVEVEKLEVR